MGTHQLKTLKCNLINFHKKGKKCYLISPVSLALPGSRLINLQQTSQRSNNNLKMTIILFGGFYSNGLEIFNNVNF